MINSNDDIHKAKKIYFDYAGSGFQMSREGVLPEYKKYNVSKEQEAKWLEELLENFFSQLDINDFNTAFPFWYIIETHNSIEYFQKFLDFLDLKYNHATNQYYLLRYGQTTFDLLERLSKSSENISREVKIRSIYLVEKLVNKVKSMSLPEKFHIQDFSIIGDGLTQQQYVLRKIVELETNLGIAKILN